MTTNYKKTAYSSTEDEEKKKITLPENGKVTVSKAYAPGFGLKLAGQPDSGIKAVYSSPSRGQTAYAPDSSTADNALNGLSKTRSFTYGGAKPVYASPYSAQIDRLFNELNSQPKFSYDPEKDEAYLSLKEKYTGLGRLAMEDTVGKASAMTGGIASSYAASSGSQVYQNYMNELSGYVPELRRFAYDVYRDGIDDKRESLEGLMRLEEEAYSRYGDELYSYYADYDRSYGQFIDELEREDRLRELEYEKERDSLEFDYKKQQDAQERADYLKELEYKMEQDALDRAFSEEKFGYQKYNDSLDRLAYAENKAYERAQDAYDREQDAIDRAWEAALFKAGYGDYSALEDFGYDSAAYAGAQAEKKTSGKENDSGFDESVEKLLERCLNITDSRGYLRKSTKAEAYVQLRKLYTSNIVSETQYDALVERIEEAYK